MRAILFAATEPDSMQMMSARNPLALFHLLDRPVLQVIIEYLIEQGVSSFDLVLNHQPEAIEAYFGDGQRWGSEIRYHLCKDPTHPYQVLHTLTLAEHEGTVLIGHIGTLPTLPEPGLPHFDPTVVTRFVEVASSEEATPGWTGWALVPPQAWAQLPRQAEYSQLASLLEAAAHTDVPCAQLLRFDNYPSLLRANTAALSGNLSPLQPLGQLIEPGVWISRNVMLHPTAKITPPIYIGENCRVGANVQLGPNAVIGSNSILDTGSIVVEAMVMRDSYIGEGLELDGVIVDKNLLVNTRLAIETHVTEQFLLSELTGQPLKAAISRLSSSALGLLLWCLTLPLALLVGLVLCVGRRGPLLSRKSYLRIPMPHDARWHEMTVWSFTEAPEQQYGLKHALLVALPALGNVVRGELRLVGLPLRSVEAVQLLPNDWRALYLAGHAGLLTEAAVRYGHAVSEEEHYAAEAYYTVRANGWYDTTLCIAALGALWRHPAKTDTF